MVEPTANLRRLAREKETVSKMIALYCRKKHASAPSQLCRDCHALEITAHQRIERCPYGAAKPTCARCPIHCYRPGQRDAIRQVMRYAGPRMLIYHPRLAVLHMLDTRRGRVS